MDGAGVLRERLAKIEALAAGGSTVGERAAARAAADRIRSRLAEAARQEPPIEIRYSLPDSFSRQLFMALCRRYGLRPYRYPRMRHQTVVVRAPRSFLEGVLWPEFVELDRALGKHLAELTERIIRTEVFGETGDADLVSEPPGISEP